VPFVASSSLRGYPIWLLLIHIEGVQSKSLLSHAGDPAIVASWPRRGRPRRVLLF
jgi:hypothetical protein